MAEFQRFLQKFSLQLYIITQHEKVYSTCICSLIGYKHCTQQVKSVKTQTIDDYRLFCQNIPISYSIVFFCKFKPKHTTLTQHNLPCEIETHHPVTHHSFLCSTLLLLVCSYPGLVLQQELFLWAVKSDRHKLPDAAVRHLLDIESGLLSSRYLSSKHAEAGQLDLWIDGTSWNNETIRACMFAPNVIETLQVISNVPLQCRCMAIHMM